MDNLVQYFDDIESSFRKMKAVTVAAVSLGIVVALGSLALSFWYVSSSSTQVYVLENGTALAARRSSNEAQRDLEARDHVIRFHELMFNLSPSKDAIERNVNAALNMADKSAYDFYKDLSEQRFYERMIQANISQQIAIDSVRVDMSHYPYSARVWATTYIIRESNVTSYSLRSSCLLIDGERSEVNPHGLTIQKFASEQQVIETRKRR